MKITKKQFAVIGLGRFGLALCEELTTQGAQVLAIDIDEERVKLAVDFASQAIIADCSNEDTVAELKLDEYDIVMVAIGEDFDTSILTSLILKESGVKNVWVKAKDKLHAKILYKIGADKIINPEREMGVRVARSMLDKRIFDFLSLGHGQAIAEVIIGGKHSGETISQHPCIGSDQLKLLAYKRGASFYENPDHSVELEVGDILIVAGDEKVLQEKIRLI